MTALELLAASIVSWGDLKDFLERVSGISRDTLHVIAGPCAQLLFAALLRTSLKSFKPWFVVLAFALANEWYDLQVETWPSFAMQIGEGSKDVVLTMALPTVLLLTARFAPSLFFSSPTQTSGPNPEK